MSSLYPPVPGPEQKIFRRLIRKTIERGETVDLQIDGLEALVSAVGRVLRSMIGEVAVGATLGRATMLTARRYPLLQNPPGGKAAPNIRWLRLQFRAETLAGTREALVALAEEWFDVLYWLLGPTLLPLLRETEAELEARQPSSGGNEEEG